MIEPTQALAFITALAVAAAIPGPGITALIARSLSGGALSGFAMLIGIILGDLTFLSFAVFGLAMIAKTFGLLFALVKWGAIAYLCYLAWQFWSADHQSLDSASTTSRKSLISSCLSGYSITLGNPKTIAFYLALLPVMIDIENITLQSWGLTLVPLTVVVLLAVGVPYIFAAISVRKALSGKKAQQVLHRGAAGIMLGTAGVMMSRET